MDTGTTYWFYQQYYRYYLPVLLDLVLMVLLVLVLPVLVYSCSQIITNQLYSNVNYRYVPPPPAGTLGLYF